MYSARLILPAEFTEDQIASISNALADISQSCAARRAEDVRNYIANPKNQPPWTLLWIMENLISGEELIARVALQAEMADLPPFQISNDDYTIEEIPDDIDWLTQSYQQFPPFEVGPFFIYGSHYGGDIPGGQIGLQIDAATAFGSGEHETTKGCLTAMLDLKEQGVCPWHVLDMGTGSGILAIAAWKLWKSPVLAVDNDPEAVRVATHHLEVNGVSPSPSSVLCKVQNGFGAKFVQEKGPYELIIANILAGPLIEMSIDVPPLIDENGYIILSGILNEQADDVLSAYEALDLVLKNRYEIGEWTSLVLHNPAA